MRNFNPRSREGSDCVDSAASISARDFNPRSREGSDRDGQPLLAGHDISIHAPAKGATQPSLSPLLFLSISIHAPAKGATLDSNA